MIRATTAGRSASFATRKPASSLASGSSVASCESIRVADLAARAHLSQRQLSRKFLEVHGLPPGQWLVRERIRLAQELLETTGDSVEAIAVRADRTAFAELFDFFAPRIKAYLRRLGLEDSAAEDIAQEVMIVLWHKANLFDPTKSSLSTWLFRVARNRRIEFRIGQ